jgi:hypothetical protein
MPLLLGLDVNTQFPGSQFSASPGATECEYETAFMAYDHVAFHRRILLYQVWARGSRFLLNWIIRLYAE